MLTVGKLKKVLQKFDDDTLINLGCSEELYQDLLDTYDGIGFYLVPKLKIFRYLNSNKDEIEFIVDYFAYDDMSDEELEEMQGPLDELHEFKKEIDIK